MVTAPPALVIAAPASGSGKTTVTTGLIGALARAGHRVAPFKVGPDYIDPGYHGLAAGRPGRNLDPVLVGEDRIGPLYRAGSAGCDIAVVEGVMGLFDGRITEDHMPAIAPGSTAQVASLLGAPVVLVIDASGHSQSLAAILHGFVSFDPSIDIRGVILNRVGSPRHEFVLRQACARAGLEVFGAVPRNAKMAVPSRHLGLIPAAERGPEAVAAIDAMTELIGGAVDLAALVAAADIGAGAVGPMWSPESEVGVDESVSGDSRPVIALASGAAFTFGYAEHSELLAAAGASVVPFDPLTDLLPDGCSGVVIGGGFPEEHAAALAANRRLLTQLRTVARSGIPIHAECAGLLYLAQSLDDHVMAGVLPLRGTFGKTLTLGYRDAVALTDSVLFDAGSRMRGHEFHRTTITALDGSKPSAWGWRRDGVAHIEGWVQGNVHASYLHTHPAGRPEVVARLVRAARTAFDSVSQY
ncbi:cobyrinate a,c-diamide synthase [Williamsia muralis]|uniref:Hydrogenobyrinate a,c-diamide synthase n=1 Tax=Williamsia marianensis TaxID=85044 RepID=A0ABU4EWA9_WILMA|nr:cobyrinate a,c-diamide synthase [Williamsia muralis]MDV7135526.1 cobyrinate a,c-diamide synthase [Williamsia muralis]